jgi:hypothetical protein
MAMARQLGCVIVADRSLAALRLAREPGDLTVGESSLATELGLSPRETLVYLAGLPKLIRENNLGYL